MNCRHRSRVRAVNVSVETEPDRVTFRVARELKSPNRWKKHLAEYYESQTWERILGRSVRNMPLKVLFPWPTGKRRVTVTRLVPSRRNLLKDDGNIFYSTKPLADALKRLGWIFDDSRKWLEAPLPTQDVSDEGEYGTGALNIDACRIGTDVVGGGGFGQSWAEDGGLSKDYEPHPVVGRWPANVLIDEIAAAALDEQTGELVSGGTPETRGADKFRNTFGAFKGGDTEDGIGRSTGGASRFYYVAKPSREERDFGCDGLPPRSGGAATDRKEGSKGLDNPHAGAGRNGNNRNFHPTVKPVELMRWLVKLVTPPDGLVLDPFMGSGTTGMACRYEHRRFVGIEREADYVRIAERRIAAVAPLFHGAEE